MTDASGAATPLTPVVFHVLLALGEGPLHGYAIMKRVARESGMNMGPGTVYGSLQRLEDAGWVAETDAVETGDRRRGRAFELTNEGAVALQAEARRITGLARHEGVRRLAANTGS